MNWLQSVHNWFQTTGRVNPVLDMSRIDFVHLYDWLTVMAMLERLLEDHSCGEVALNFEGNEKWPIYQNKPQIPKSKLKIAGFLGSLQTHNALRCRRAGGFRYVPLGDTLVSARSFYSREGRKDEKETTILPIIRIRGPKEVTESAEIKADCRQFLDVERIAQWREHIDPSISSSTLFRDNEVFRTCCHELAANIFEHTGSAGFITGRVIRAVQRPVSKTEKRRTSNQLTLPNWCSGAFPSELAPQIEQVISTGGILELCVSDAGPGIVHTLSGKLKEMTLSSDVNADAVLAFAFDPLGTCKSAEDCWATERHALGRMLQFVQKFGGCLRVRSGGMEVTYVASKTRMRRIPGYLGVAPSFDPKVVPDTPGTHYQILLPLEPLSGVRRMSSSEQGNVLTSALPRTFRIDSDQPTGYLLPLRHKFPLHERRSADDRPAQALEFPSVCGPADFRKACYSISEELKLRPVGESVILDFSDLEGWEVQHFETLLYLLYNVLQDRAVLLIEIASELAATIDHHELTEAESQLDEALGNVIVGHAGGVLEEQPDRAFLWLWSSLKATFVAIDRDGHDYIFGLRDPSGQQRRYKDALLRLLNTESSFKSLVKEFKLEPAVFSAILNGNPLFEEKGSGVWRAIWSQHALAVQKSRVMTQHFDSVALRCKAWRGLPTDPSIIAKRRSDDSGKEFFNIPWQREWVRRFFECSRILSRERYADEAAQRLIFRMQEGLALVESSLSEVKVLACVTAPAILLATAMHRRWPRELQRPAIIDLGPYRLLKPDQRLPYFSAAGAIIFVQDVIDGRTVSPKAVNLLRDRKLKVLAVVSLVQLVTKTEWTSRHGAPVETPSGACWRETQLSEGWSRESETPVHSVIQLLRSERIESPPSDVSDEQLFWVEQRSLRPFRYSSLRGRRRSRNDEPVDHLKPLFEPTIQSLICAGHYVFGTRHYSVALDIQRAVAGLIGQSVAEWVAAVCLDETDVKSIRRKKPDWETDVGYRRCRGDVTAVLMPLHSRIHYIWPIVEKLLAQRGRRQPMWMLDATLLLGAGPTYQVPIQFYNQVEDAMREMISKGARKSQSPGRLRVLVLDDAMHTGHTVETILYALRRCAAKAWLAIKTDYPELRSKDIAPRVFQWVRVFSIFNQISEVELDHWRSVHSISATIPFRFSLEAYCHLPGVPTYSELECPTCADLERLKRLQVTAHQRGTAGARSWIERTVKALEPIAVDSPGFHEDPKSDNKSQYNVISLRSPIEVIKITEPNSESNRSDARLERYRTTLADVAIWRFFELMFYSRPISDVLLTLNTAWPKNDVPKAEDVAAEDFEYARYRWTIVQWCIRNWHRVVADSAEAKFFEALNTELGNGSPLFEMAWEALALHARDDSVRRALGAALRQLRDLEGSSVAGADGSINEEARLDRNRMLPILQNGLTLFLLHFSRDEVREPFFRVDTQRGIEEGASIVSLLRALNKESRHQATFVKNLLGMLTMPVSASAPDRDHIKWALRIIAENLFRSGRLDQNVTHSHLLLRRLVKDAAEGVRTAHRLQLLSGCLSLFIAGLNRISLVAVEASQTSGTIGGVHGEIQRITRLSVRVQEWLSSDVVAESPEAREDLKSLNDALALEKPFAKWFGSIFHERVEEIEKILRDTYMVGVPEGFKLAMKCDAQTRESRALIHIHRLCQFLSNYAIDPVRSYKQTTESRIEVTISRTAGFGPRLCFRILTRFTSFQEAKKLTEMGDNFAVEKDSLELFGATVESLKPAESPLRTDLFETGDGFSTELVVHVPAGYIHPIS